VSVSLAIAIAVAVPLGVVCYRRPRLGKYVLGVVSAIQTIPSMALLVFMIPLLGLGTWPALVALFLYSLLPIVRNTCTGLSEVSPALREAAEDLGLPPWARLWRIELPLASRSILSGIKTAAVINVGTATIGAIIGAGGYGQSIITGIRLDNLWIIMAGAVPAAAMALGIQGLFAVLERFIVPRGLQVA
jgi:osmoprotectant transport system permease protein